MMDTEDNCTIGYYSRVIGVEPVVGWLVCTEGEYKGESFKLKSGRNFIGRAAEALNERLESSRQELKRLEGELDMLCSSLNSYANALEEADRRAAQIMAGD